MSWRMGRQLPFLRSILKAADHQTRRELLQAANADQIKCLERIGHEHASWTDSRIVVHPDQVTASSTSTERHDPS